MNDDIRIPTERKSLAFIVSAHNEEKLLAGTLEKLLSLSRKYPAIRYAAIVADDGSRDGTLEIARRYADQFPDIFGFVHFPENVGVGEAFLQSARHQNSEFICCVPGDDMLEARCFELLLEGAHAGQPVISYLQNADKRAWRRQLISRLYSGFWTKLLGLGIEYINGTCTYRSSDLKRVRLYSRRFCLFAELTAKTIVMGTRYAMVPFNIRQEDLGQQNISPNQMKSLLELPGAFLSTLYLLVKSKFGRSGK